MTVVPINGSGEHVSPEAMSTKIDFLRDDVQEVKDALHKLSDAIIKLAVVEQQQNHFAVSLERAFKAVVKVDERIGSEIGKLDARMAKLELAAPEQSTAAKWVDRGVVALAGAGAMFIAKASGLM